MDDIPVPEIVELTPAPGGPSGGPFHRSPLGPEGRGIRALVVIAILVAAVAGGVGWEPLDVASARPSPAPSSASGATASVRGVVPDVLRHAWERPMAITPGEDRWASGRLRIESGSLEFRSTVDATVSTSAVTSSGPDSLLLTATEATEGCAPGDLGSYRSLLEGKGTVLTLTASLPDACRVRETMLAGSWVRSDLPPPDAGATALAPGTYRTTNFDPFGDPAGRGRLSYTVPAGWEVADDSRSVSVLHHGSAAAPGRPTSDDYVLLISGARVADDFEDGATCGPTKDAPGVGGGLDDIVRAITTRPGVVVTRHESVVIGGRAGILLDLHIAKSRTGGCEGPDGRFVAIPLVNSPPAGGANIGLAASQPIRLVLLDLGGARTLAVTVAPPGGTPFGELVASAMPIVESFEFVPPEP